MDFIKSNSFLVITLKSISNEKYTTIRRRIIHINIQIETGPTNKIRTNKPVEITNEHNKDFTSCFIIRNLRE